MLQKAFTTEEESFKRAVNAVTRSSVPCSANIIPSHVLYKIKIEKNNALKFKVQIAPHGSEDSIRHELSSNCSIFAPLNVRILIFIATIRKWRLSCVDVKSSFLQTGAAERSVYVIPPREFQHRI